MLQSTPTRTKIRRKPNKKRLNEEVVKTAKYDRNGPQVQYLWDTETSGFGIRLYPSGKKSYVVGFRIPGSPKMRFAVINQVGRKKVKPAREEARLILANHEDPVAKKRDETQLRLARELEHNRNPRMSTVIDDYFAYHENRRRVALAKGSGKHLSEQSLQQYRWTIEKHIRHRWQEIPIKQILRPDIKSFIRKMAEENSDFVANNVLQRLKGLMAFALNEDYLDHNPCLEIKTDYQYIPTERVLSEEEIRMLWFNLSKTTMNKSIQLAVKLLLITAQRRSEIVTASWDWVDFKQKILTVPKSSVKNRKGNNIVPLSDLALDVLSEMKELAGATPYLVPSSQHPDKHTAPQTVTNRLRENITNLGFDVDDKFTPHDLRRTVASMLSSEEVEREHIKVVLNHSFNDTTEVYINTGYVNQKRRYLDLWADKLKRILDGGSLPSNVVEINR